MAVTQASSRALIFGAAGDALPGKYHVTYLRWVGATTAGHSCVLRDEDGNKIFESYADGQYFLDVHALFQITRGLTVSTMDSGLLYVYIR